MKTPFDVVKTLLRTEKGTTQLPFNKYYFIVDNSCNKIEIKKAIEDIYKVKVESINSMIVPGKKRRVRFKEGKRPDWKKVVATLKEGYKIEVT